MRPMTMMRFTFDYLRDMPFAGMAVNREWAGIPLR